MAHGRTAAEHYTQAQRNEAFYHQIGGSHSANPEWAMTALFYVVVHEVEAALRAVNAPRSSDHHSRKAALRTLSPPLAAQYETLYGLSVAARYECVRHSQTALALAEARLPMIRAAIAKLAPPPY